VKDPSVQKAWTERLIASFAVEGDHVDLGMEDHGGLSLASSLLFQDIHEERTQAQAASRGPYSDALSPHLAILGPPHPSGTYRAFVCDGDELNTIGVQAVDVLFDSDVLLQYEDVVPDGQAVRQLFGRGDSNFGHQISRWKRGVYPSGVGPIDLLAVTV